MGAEGSRAGPPGPRQPNSLLSSSRLAWLLALLVLLVAAGIRVRLRTVPLERDEGEYAYAGQLILQGAAPYVHVYNMKMPGIYACYAGILAVFGQTAGGIRVGLLLANLLAAGLTAAIVRRRFGGLAGASAAAAYGILSLSPTVQGTFANAEHFVVLPALAGLWLLDRTRRSPRARPWHAVPSLPAAGFLLGAGFVVKQHGIAFVVFGAAAWLAAELARRPRAPRRIAARAAILAGGALLPLGMTCLVLWRAGALANFRFWVLDYASTYVAAVPLEQGLTTLLARSMRIVMATPGIWILVAAGIAILVRGSLSRDPETRERSLLAAGFLAASFLAVCPGFYFRPHYFVLLLPAASMAAGVATASLAGWRTSREPRDPAPATPPPRRSPWLRGDRIAIPLLGLALAQGVFAQRGFFLEADPVEASRQVYGPNPFPESIEVARYLREHTSPTERIAVVGSEPQIYFYARRRGATGYIYTYALMEVHPFAARMQREMRREIEQARPRYLVFVNASSSWIVRPRSRRGFLDWFGRYQAEHYRPCGYADIRSAEHTEYVWDGAARHYRPRGRVWLGVYERKTP